MTCPCILHPTDAACRLLHDDQRESGLLSVLSRLVKGFSHRHQPRAHAADLVESIHVLLRLLERLSAQSMFHRAFACFHDAI